MSVQALDWAMRQRTVTPLEKLLLIFLSDRTDCDGLSDLEGVYDFSSATMADVRRAVMGLAAQELLTLEGGRFRLAITLQPTEPPVRDVPKNLRSMLIAEAGACVACGATDRLAVDHVIPRSRGGTSDLANLQVLCTPCNSSKGNKAPGDWKGRAL